MRYIRYKKRGRGIVKERQRERERESYMKDRKKHRKRDRRIYGTGVRETYTERK